MKDLRVTHHRDALLAHQKGHFDRFKEQISLAQQHGENISLLLDLAAFYYQQGDIQNWRKSISELKTRLCHHREQLSFSSRFQVELLLAKCAEEEGSVHTALGIYERLYHEIRAVLRSDLYHQCLPQLLRLKASFGLNQELGALYAELLTLKTSLISTGVAFEIQHSLMLAEMTLVGSEHAWARVQAAFNNSQTPMADLRLIFYDFAEEQILKKRPLPKLASELATQLQDHDSFELELHRLAFSNVSARDAMDLNHKASDMSWAAHIRLLTLYAVSLADSVDGSEIINKLKLTIANLDSQSRQFWLSRLQDAIGVKLNKINFYVKERCLQYYDKRVDLSKKRSLIELVRALAESSQLNVEHVIERIWCTSYSPESYHRLRMTVHRLNNLLADLTGCEKTVEITSENVCFRGHFEFEIV